MPPQGRANRIPALQTTPNIQAPSGIASMMIAAIVRGVSNWRKRREMARAVAAA
jgi:hypothetical protein